MKQSSPIVLVVHPEGDARTSLYVLLAAEGHAVATRSRGLDALEYIAKHRPGAVLASTRLTDVGLAEFLGDIERAGFASNTLLLADPDDLDLFADSEGPTEVLPWPAREADLLAAVGRCLEGASQRVPRAAMNRPGV